MKITNVVYTQPFQSYSQINADYTMHQHEHVELIYVANGSLRCEIAENQITLKSRQCLILFPYTPHAINEPEDHSADVLKILFTLEFIDDFKKIFCEYTLNEMIFDLDELEEGSQTALKWLSKWTKETTGPDSFHLPQGWLTVVLGDFFHKRVLQKNEEMIDPAIIRQLFDYLDSNMQQEVNLSTAASALGVSQYFLTHMIGKVLHTSFHSLLHSVKIAHGKELLRNTSYSLLDIALDCGYQNTKTFSRNFKEQTGMTPMQYRNA